MRLALIIACYLWLCLNGSAQFLPAKGQQIRVVHMNGKRGLVRPYFPNSIAQPLYDEITWLSNSSFLVKRGNYYGILDTFGVEKIKPDTYTHAAARTDIEPGKTVVLFFIYKPERQEQNLLTDENGNILARNFYQVTEKDGNLMIVTVSSGDSLQRQLFFKENEYDQIFKYGILKTDGTWLIKPERREFRFVSDYCIAATENINPYPDVKLTLLNREGRSIINGEQLNYNYDGPINDSLRKLNQICVQNDETEWFVDSMGTIVSKRPRPVSEIKIIMDSASKKYGGQLNGKWILQPRYTYIYPTFFYVMAYDTAKKTVDIYDKRSRSLTSTSFNSVYTVHYYGHKKRQVPDKELLFGAIGGDAFLLDKNYKPVSEAIEAASLLIYSKGDAALFLFKMKNGPYAFMNQAGKIVINPPHDYYAYEQTFEENNLIHIKTGRNTFHVYDLNGTLHFTDITSVKISTLNPGICYVLKNGRETAYLRKNFKALAPEGTYTGFNESPKHNIVIASNDEGKFILDKNFRLLSKTPFKKIELDSFALLATTLNNKKQVLAIGGNKLSKEYDSLSNSCGTCYNKVYAVKNNNKYGLINYKGKTLITCEWDTLQFFGKRIVVRSGQKFYLSDTNYVLHKNMTIDSIKPYCWHGGFIYKTNDKWHLPAEKTGNAIEFDEGIFECTNNDLISIKNNGKYGVYSLVKRKWTVEPVFDSAVTFTNKYNDKKHVYFTQKNGKKYLIDTLKNTVIEPGFDFIAPMQSMVGDPNTHLNNHLVNNGGKKSQSVMTGATNNIITAGKFGIVNSKAEPLHNMNGDHVITLVDENYGTDYYDTYNIGNVVGFLWNIGGTVEEYMSYMSDSVEQVSYDIQGNEHIVKVGGTSAYDKKITGGKFGIVGPNGNEILPVIYDKIIFMYTIGDDDRDHYHRKNYSDVVYNRGAYDRLLLFPVFLQKDGKWGAADLSGKLIIPVEYDSIADATFQNEKTIQVWKNRRYGFFDLLGKTLLPTDYSNEQYYDTHSEDDTFTSFTILQKGGSLKGYYFVQKVEQVTYNEAGEEKLIMTNDTMRFNYFNGGKLGIFDPGNFKTYLAAEYDDIRFMQQVDDPAKKFLDLRLSVAQKSSLKPEFRASFKVPCFEIKKSGRWGIYVFNKRIIVEPQYEDIEVIYATSQRPRDGYKYQKNDAKDPGPEVGFKFKQSGKWGMLNLDGKIILNAEYDSIGFTDGNVYKAIKGGKTKFFDTNGQPVQE